MLPALSTPLRACTLSILLLSTSCARASPADLPASPAPAQAAPAQAAPAQAAIPPKRIAKAHVSLEAPSPARARAALAAHLADHGGYVESVETDGPPTELRIHLVARLPEPSLDGAIAALRRVGTLHTERRESTDVTRDYVDSDARLRNLQRTEERLLALLAQSSGSLEHILQVERELTRVRGEIEQLASQLRALDHSVALASLTVDLSAAPAVRAPDDALASLWSLGRDAGGVMASSAALLVSTLAFAARVLLALVPWAPLTWLLVWSVRRFRRRAA